MPGISAFKLSNSGQFVFVPAAIWIDGNRSEQKTPNGPRVSQNYIEFFNPGDYGVPNLADVKLHIQIEAGDERVDRNSFRYDSSSSEYAEFRISGTTRNNDVEFVGIRKR